MSLYIGNDSDVLLNGMQDGITGTYLTTGTATYELTRQGNSTVIDSGSLAYVAGSMTVNGTVYPDGNYLGVISGTVTADLVKNVNYQIKISFTQGDYIDPRYLIETAYYRGAT